MRIIRGTSIAFPSETRSVRMVTQKRGFMGSKRCERRGRPQVCEGGLCEGDKSQKNGTHNYLEIPHGDDYLTGLAGCIR